MDIFIYGWMDLLMDRFFVSGLLVVPLILSLSNDQWMDKWNYGWMGGVEQAIKLL